MVIEKNIRKHNFLRGGPEWVIIYGTCSGTLYDPGLTGTKGEGFNHNFIWVPYVMSIDPVTDFQPRQGILSRYGTKTVNNRYYSTITV